MRQGCILLLTLFALTRFSVAEAEPALNAGEFQRVVQPFFAEHCVACHGAKKQKGKRRFDQLAYPIANDNALIDFQDAVDLLNLGEMPPKNEPQPSPNEKQAVIAWMTAAIAEAQAARSSTGGETVLRRLNAREYRHTVGDLFGIDVEGFDPTESFPADNEVHHLDNQGQTLVTSGFLLDQLLTAADQVMHKALPPLEKPERREWSFTTFKLQPELHFRRHKIERMAGHKSDGVPSFRLFEHPRSHRHMGSYGYVADFAKGVPEDGLYLVSLRVEAMNRQPKHPINYMRTDTNAPMILAVIPGDHRVGDLHLPQPIEPELARFELTTSGVQKVEARVWLNKGMTPRFIYVNGSDRMRPAHILLGRKLENIGEKEKVESAEKYLVRGMADDSLPHIRIDHVFVRGPLSLQWPTPTQVDLLGGKTFDAARNRANLERVMAKVYRRPATAAEVDQILAVIAARQGQGIASYDAYRDGLKAMLCSPGFLYLEEAADEEGMLEDTAIAARLSYFLWATTPDERLLKLAAERRLRDPAVRRAQVKRMLADPKSDRFVNGFLDSWLTLGALGETPPDRNLFGEYYRDDLQAAMRRETFLFARHILDEGRSIDEFIQSDYTFANPALARLYGLREKPAGRGFEKVSLAGTARGGLIGQASVLTVTANGVDTSPIVRGVWLLENLLGTPPSPPPPDVEPLDPDIRGATTIREQLVKHRSDPACAECHRKIDPLGFALEPFDAIGRYRSGYRKGRVKIDASGELPSGVRFSNVQQFRAGLMQEKEKFARALTEKLMAYALGRGMEISDRPELDAILAELEKEERNFGFLVERVVTSSTFVRP